jgi:hypothetical protein
MVQQTITGGLGAPTASGSLTGSNMSCTTCSNVTLPSVGTAGWNHFGGTNSSATVPGIEQSTTGGSQFGTPTQIGTGTPTLRNPTNTTFNWTGGTPDATGPSILGIYVQPGANGYTQIITPTAVGSHTLTSYVSCQGTGTSCSFNATLSSPCSPCTYSASLGASTGNGTDYTVTIPFTTVSSGQTVTVTFQGAATIEAAIIQGNALQ